jgi:2,4-dienoyl-CoA reductase-like NADH-dependent reductase (Old Yellow Enzyme family)
LTVWPFFLRSARLQAAHANHPVVGWALSAISISCLGRAAVGLPAFVAGRINQPQIAEEVLAAGLADMCGMTRQ